jgi:methylphosphotriester-DNA--protein-cysteine methyltransferase
VIDRGRLPRSCSSCVLRIEQTKDVSFLQERAIHALEGFRSDLKDFEGTSFTDLVDDTRYELAQHYLCDARMTFSEIAYLFGYADQSTFFRASHRWFGESPGEYRARVLQGHEGEDAATRRK